MSRYRFLLTPKWIFGHVLLVVMVLFFVWAGFWQLSRLAEARSARALGEERVVSEPVALQDVLAQASDIDDLAYRRVEVSGTYLPGLQVATAPRSRQGRPGHLLLTPLQPAGGDNAVLVERGWVPFDRDGVPFDEAAPTEGEVRVEGVLMPLENPAGREAFNEAGLVRFVNPPAMQEDLGVALQPLVLRLLQQQPAQPGSLPLPGEVPVFGEGSHRSYAFQWFSFATVAVIGYPILLRRTARERATQPQLVSG